MFLQHFLNEYSEIVFLVLLFLIKVISAKAVNDLYQLFKMIFRFDIISFWLLSLLLLPGTLIHELSHYFMAKILLLKVTSFRILPKRLGSIIRLGEVSYEKADGFRGILVGIAPFFSGLAIIQILSKIAWNTHHEKFVFGILIYLVFSITSTMFSSPEDLREWPFIIPIAAVIFLLPLVGINLSMSRNIIFMNTPLLTVICIHCLIIVGVSLVASILRISGRLLS